MEYYIIVFTNAITLLNKDWIYTLKLGSFKNIIYVKYTIIILDDVQQCELI